MNERKREILQNALIMIEEDGYTALTMRQLASACDIKLASLQYYFPNWHSLLLGLADEIVLMYRERWESTDVGVNEATIRELATFIMDDLGDPRTIRLFPQLWAMALVEPIIRESIDKIYAPYKKLFETRLKALGREKPELDALLLISMFEGATLFLGKGQQWGSKRLAAKKHVLALIEQFDEI